MIINSACNKLVGMEKGYTDAVNLLSSQGKFYIELGLERIAAVLELLGNPQDKLKYFHVAGTNGKGSVCAILASLLKEAGMKTGLYTSPHIFKYTERIKINGKDISDDDFGKYVFDISNLADIHNIHLTEFEILTAVMFKYFADNNVDVVVLETGLGGRFDATNVIKSNLCAIITHIDLDHTERLGNTKDKIAFEKAGIIKPGCPVVTCEGYEAIKDKADESNSLFVMVAPFEDTSELALKGTYQQENLSLAIAAIKLVYPKLPQETILKGLHNVKHPCRFEYIENKNILIDAAHNPNGALALRESLDMYFPNRERRFIFGCLKTKNYEKMMDILFSEGDEIYLNHFDYPGSADFGTLKAACKYPVKQFKSLGEIDLNDGKLTIICGSFYMLKSVLAGITV